MQVPLTSYGLWDQFMEARGAAPRYTLNRINYDAMASLLIPRAIAYSAGLLDYFFRGRMEIGLPDAGFYGVVDHSLFAPPNPPTDVVNGFKGFARVRVKLGNTTDAITPPGGQPIAQDMSGGILVAVLKFRRAAAPCYDDLLVQWPTDPAVAQSCRSPTEEIVVSDPVAVTSGSPIPIVAPGGPGGSDYTFAFPGRQLPINAWDVVLQIVYRGRLGTEDDAVVVATRDISEPTYATIANITDFVALDGRFYLPAVVAGAQSLLNRVKPDCRTGVPGSYELWPGCYNRIDQHWLGAGSSAVRITAAGPTAIMPRRFARLAFLTDPNAPAVLNWLGTSCETPAAPLTVPRYPAQVEGQDTWHYGVPGRFRGTNTWQLLYCTEDVGVVPTPWSASMQQQLDDLTGEALVPTPVTISGWD
jgi:hypothetical protein